MGTHHFPNISQPYATSSTIFPDPNLVPLANILPAGPSAISFGTPITLPDLELTQRTNAGFGPASSSSNSAAAAAAAAFLLILGACFLRSLLMVSIYSDVRMMWEDNNGGDGGENDIP